MNDDRPSSRILAAWADVSARSKAPIARRPEVRAGRTLRTAGRLAAAAVVMAVGFLVVVSLPRAPTATQPPTASAPSAIGSAESPPLSSSPIATGSASPTPSTPPNPIPLADVRAGALLTATDGWALTAADLLVTHDGGHSWTATSKLATATDRVVGAAFADPLHGWVVSDRVPPSGAAGVLGVDVRRTDDGGATWETVELVSIPSPGPDPLVAFPTTSVVSDEIVYVLLQSETASGPDVRLFATADGGRTWESRRDVPQRGLRSMTFVDPLVGWIIGDAQNALLRTVDGGSSWLEQSLPAVAGLRARDLYPLSGPTRMADGRLACSCPRPRTAVEVLSSPAATMARRGSS